MFGQVTLALHALVNGIESGLCGGLEGHFFRSYSSIEPTFSRQFFGAMIWADWNPLWCGYEIQISWS